MPKKKVGCRTVPAESSKSRPDHPRAPSSDGQAQTQNDTNKKNKEKQCFTNASCSTFPTFSTFSTCSTNKNFSLAHGKAQL